jgi:hypothetical protein
MYARVAALAQQRRRQWRTGARSDVDEIVVEPS